MNLSELTVVVGLSKGFWPHLKLSIQSIPKQVSIVVSWYGPGSPDALPANATLVRPQRYENNFMRGYVLNVGIRAVTTPYVMLGDADFLYPRELFGTLAVYQNCVLRCYVGRLTPDASLEVRSGVRWEDLYCDYQGVDGRIFGQIFGAHNPCVYPTELLFQLRGYDERMEGWGGEDDDLTARTRRIGVREQRLPVVVADLFHQGSDDCPDVYQPGKPPQKNLAVLKDTTRPIAANPHAWGDAC